MANQIDYKNTDAMVDELIRLEGVDDRIEKDKSISLMHLNTTQDEWFAVIDKYREVNNKI